MSSSLGVCPLSHDLALHGERQTCVSGTEQHYLQYRSLIISADTAAAVRSEGCRARYSIPPACSALASPIRGQGGEDSVGMPRKINTVAMLLLCLDGGSQTGFEMVLR